MINPLPSSRPPSGYRFPRAVIAVAVRWYLRYGLSYRDVEELLAERGITVDHVTVYRWVQTFTTEFIDAARPCRHAPGDRWFVDETHVKITGRWTYLYRAVDQHGQIVDVLLSARRDLSAARTFFSRALRGARRRSRSPPTARRPTRWYWTNCSRLPGMSLSSTPTTPSKLTMAGSKPDCDRCADSNATARRERSPPGTRSCRTCAAATTTSPPNTTGIGWLQHSPN